MVSTNQGVRQDRCHDSDFMVHLTFYAGHHCDDSGLSEVAMKYLLIFVLLGCLAGAGCLGTDSSEEVYADANALAVSALMGNDDNLITEVEANFHSGHAYIKIKTTARQDEDIAFDVANVIVVYAGIYAIHPDVGDLDLRLKGAGHMTVKQEWLTGIDLKNDQQLADLTTKVLESYQS